MACLAGNVTPAAVSEFCRVPRKRSRFLPWYLTSSSMRAYLKKYFHYVLLVVLSLYAMFEHIYPDGLVVSLPFSPLSPKLYLLLSSYLKV